MKFDWLADHLRKQEEQVRAEDERQRQTEGEQLGLLDGWKALKDEFQEACTYYNSTVRKQALILNDSERASLPTWVLDEFRISINNLHRLDVEMHGDGRVNAFRFCSSPVALNAIHRFIAAKLVV